VDFDRRRLKALVQKTRRVLTIPLNDAAHGVLEAWNAMRKGPYVFFN
jgi:hypothetical protein